MEYIMIFDTETTSLDKPFCYDVGYSIVNDESFEVALEKHFVVEQTWHNLPLFESAYYKEKRPLYIGLMRQHKTTMNKWGYIMREMARDIKNYNVEHAYAYNSGFDDKVFTFNCDWFKCMNPLDNVAIHDIWGYATQFITNTLPYKMFCEAHERYTDTGNYKGSAEVVYQYITNNPDFVEAHMGLYDSQIERKILEYCIKEYNAPLHQDYQTTRILPRLVPHPFTVKVNGDVIFEGEYIKKYNRNDVWNFTTT